PLSRGRERDDREPRLGHLPRGHGVRDRGVAAGVREARRVGGDPPNVLPILADASKPDAYRGRIEAADFLYQDVAQREQVSIFRENLRLLQPGRAGVLMLKARSVDVAAKPEDVYRRAGGELRRDGLRVVAAVPLEPFQRDHAALVLERSDR
ncbi:MAG TPA: fibrillarin-like rRNA/tRNA 2'-O-methyltransferase, partial [Thermoplasmata archaeon]|nr:fibrillarin-like rRNA/tRNA 2'-O-methyltransferase [Thermoplasmata archaeon]